VFREGDPFGAIAAVRAGTVKTYMTDADGREQVLGFHLPGEVIGLNAIHDDRYPCNAVALDTVMLCRFSFPRIALLATRLPNLQQHLFKLMSRDIGVASLFAGDHSADERMAAFLIGLSRRLALRGFSPRRFQLTMSRHQAARRRDPRHAAAGSARADDTAPLIATAQRPGRSCLALHPGRSTPP
jgi:CRP/FNR family transcriptional regulator